MNDAASATLCSSKLLSRGYMFFSVRKVIQQHLYVRPPSWEVRGFNGIFERLSNPFNARFIRSCFQKFQTDNACSSPWKTHSEKRFCSSIVQTLQSPNASSEILMFIENKHLEKPLWLSHRGPLSCHYYIPIWYIRWAIRFLYFSFPRESHKNYHNLVYQKWWTDCLMFGSLRGWDHIPRSLCFPSSRNNYTSSQLPIPKVTMPRQMFLGSQDLHLNIRWTKHHGQSIFKTRDIEIMFGCLQVKV